MVKKEDIDLLLRLDKYPNKCTPIDFEIVSNLLDQYPDFDFLRKVFVSIGQILGARGELFEKEVEKWELRKVFYPKNSKAIVQKKQPKKEKNSISACIDQFIEHFKPINKPADVKF